MARKKAEPVSLPTKPYVPTPGEQATLDRQDERRAKQGPRPKMARDAAKGVIGIAHKDEVVGGDLYQASLGGTDWEFARLMTAHIAGLCASDVSDMDQKVFAGHQAMVQGIGPQDEIEGMLAVQMAAIHSATMQYASRLRAEKRVPIAESYERGLNRLARTFTAQIEALKRHRTRGVQKVIVQHVQVNEGGQAVVAGEMLGGGATSENRDQPHERDEMRVSEREAVLSAIEAVGMPVPGASGDGLERMSVPRSEGRPAPRAIE